MVYAIHKQQESTRNILLSVIGIFVLFTLVAVYGNWMLLSFCVPIAFIAYGRELTLFETMISSLAGALLLIILHQSMIQ